MIRKTSFTAVSFQVTMTTPTTLSPHPGWLLWPCPVWRAPSLSSSHGDVPSPVAPGPCSQAWTGTRNPKYTHSMKGTHKHNVKDKHDWLSTRFAAKVAPPCWKLLHKVGSDLTSSRNNRSFPSTAQHIWVTPLRRQTCAASSEPWLSSSRTQRALSAEECSAHTRQSLVPDDHCLTKHRNILTNTHAHKMSTDKQINGKGEVK